MRVDLHLPAGWSRRVNLEALRDGLSRISQGMEISLPPEPKDGPEIFPLEVPNEMAFQFTPEQIGSLAKRVISATLAQERSPRQSGLHLSESTRQSFTIISSLVAPLILLALLIWFLSRGAKAASEFASWPAGGAAA